MIRVFTDPRCLEHSSPAGFPEVPRRLQGILEELEQRGHPIVREASHDAADEMVRAVHDPAYVDRFQRCVARGDGLLDSADNPLSAGTWAAAWGAVETLLTAVDHQLSEGGGAFAAVRPPGHHAEHALAMGFCYLNNVAVAAEYLRRHHGLERVAIFDFDVHHGNGTQHLFEERGDVLYASSHQFPFYPGTGAASERGRGDGAETTVNAPLAAGSGDEELEAAVQDIILPALRDFRPDALLLSAGFDAWKGDPLGGLTVSRDAFRRLGFQLAELADVVCEGRMVSVLEGGYDLEALPSLVASYLEGCAGRGEDDPAS
jgi:acetoin utilization deacetylase AcuC-like enzyme